ncbi:MAG: NADH-quinone oxidoreductase subunit C [Candidatus Marinimicrobia bacterium]|jgi:NADH-quinone oxidoreductase subunit C|nr:NADH-quinone oxidoreductase subunit C [Candidatus Neomarinimicrobiota bacterium]
MDVNKIFESISTIEGIVLNSEANVIMVPSASLLAVADKFKNDIDLNFDFLMCVTALDNGDSENFTIAYNFHSNKHNHSVELRVVVVDGEGVPSLASIWKTADWHEREAYDLMGIKFIGHPELKRILLPEDWEGFPLRKNYKVADYYHGVPIPKDKSYWE